MADVFISYSREDREYAEAFVKILQRRGLSIWWDTELMPADKFRERLEKEIESAYSVVVLWSKHSRASKWVPDEAAIAHNMDKLISVSLDGKAPPIGLGASSEHFADLSDWSPNDPYKIADSIFESIERLVPPRESVEHLKSRIGEIENSLTKKINSKLPHVYAAMAFALVASALGYIYNVSRAQYEELEGLVGRQGEKGEKAVLACFTGGYSNNPDYARTVGIINYQGIGYEDIESDDYTLVPYSDETKQWGLKCNDGWVNTGCSSTGLAGPTTDVIQGENGCFTTDDKRPSKSEIIYTTCCKLKFDSTQ